MPETPSDIPTHEAMAVKIPFVADRAQLDQLMADLEDRAMGIADRFVARIKEGFSTGGEGPLLQTIAATPAPEPVSTRSGGQLPPDVETMAMDLMREFSGIRGSGSSPAGDGDSRTMATDIREIRDTLNQVRDSLAVLVGKLTGGGGGS